MLEVVQCCATWEADAYIMLVLPIFLCQFSHAHSTSWLVSSWTIFQQPFAQPADLTSSSTSIMGQSSSKHGREANKTKTGLALSATGKRLVDKLRHSHPSTLHNAIETIPVEIFMNIVKYLPASSVRSLSYTCRSLSHIFGASAAELMGEPPFQWHLEPRRNVLDAFCRRSDSEPSNTHLGTEPNEWWELMVMLHRDKMWPGKAVCSACIGVHDRSAFSQSSLRGPQTESKCLGMSGVVKICPHHQVDFLDLKEKCNSPGNYKRLLRKEHARSAKLHNEDEDVGAGAWKAGLSPKQIKKAETKIKAVKELASAQVASEKEHAWTTGVKKTCNTCIIPVTIQSWGRSRVCFPVAVKKRDSLRNPTQKDLTNHMKLLDAAVCPHLKMNSPAIMNAYCAKCKRSGGEGCHCRKCAVPYHECASCRARFWFEIGDFPRLQRVIHLVVVRNFDPSVGVTNSTWINQLTPTMAKDSDHKSWWFERMALLDEDGCCADFLSVQDGRWPSSIFYFSRECYPCSVWGAGLCI